VSHYPDPVIEGARREAEAPPVWLTAAELGPWLSLVRLMTWLPWSTAGAGKPSRLPAQLSDRLQRLGFGHDSAQGAEFVQVTEHLQADGLV